MYEINFPRSGKRRQIEAVCKFDCSSRLSASHTATAGTRAERWMPRYQGDCLTAQWKETVKGFSSSGDKVGTFTPLLFTMCADDKEEK